MSLLATRSPACAATIPTADGFIASLGVGVRPNDVDANGRPSYGHPPAKVAQRLQWLGVKLARVESGDVSVAQLTVLCRAGIRLHLLHSYWPDMRQERALPPGCVAGVEGPNEPNLRPNWTDTSLRTFQAALFEAARAWDRSVPVLVPAQGFGAPKGGDMTQWATRENLHLYCYSYGASGAVYGSIGFNGCVAYEADVASGGRVKLGHGRWDTHKPLWITESGASTIPGNPGGGIGLTDADKTFVVLRNYLNGALYGAERTFIYQLMDSPGCGVAAKANDIECHFGLFNHLGEPVPAAQAVRNLVAVLRSAGVPSGDPNGLDLSFTGAPADLHVLQLARNDGTVAVVMWREDPFRQYKAGDADSAFPTVSLRVCAGESHQWSEANVGASASLTAISTGTCVTTSLGADVRVLVAR